MATIISFANQKGGAGKSTTLSLYTAYLRKYHPDLRVLVIDADDIQRTLKIARTSQENELVSTIGEEQAQERFGNVEVVSMDAIDVPMSIESLVPHYDFIFLDLPGSLSHKGLVESLSICDYILSPFQASDPDIYSTHNFINFINNTIHPFQTQHEIDKAKTILFLNNVSKGAMFNQLQKVIKATNNTFLGYPVLINYLPNQVSLKNLSYEFIENSSTLSFCQELHNTITNN